MILGKAPHPGNFSVRNSWTSPERVVRADRRREALEMRTRGATFREIARHLSPRGEFGPSVGAARAEKYTARCRRGGFEKEEGFSLLR